MVLRNQHSLSRRERQIMDVLIARGRASATEIQAAIPDPPGYSAVRATLRIMEEKGHIRHEQHGASYVYLPKIAPERAKRSALRHVLDTFFNGSPEQVMAALLDSKPSTDELDRIAEMIEAARRKGR
jgi:BlaI family transcriptional regulator, penicillinase repressor